MTEGSGSVESFVRVLAQLGASAGLGQELMPGRLLLAVNAVDEPELYIHGERESFGVPRLHQVLSWDRFVIDGSQEPIPALVVRTTSGVEGHRVMAHIAYEAFRLATEGLENHELLERLHPFLFLAQSRRMLSPGEQIGLVGELLLLEELLEVCSDSRAQERALDTWVGPLGAHHDFYRDGTVVEVKAGPSATHRVGYHQLLPGPDEELFLASARVRRDASAQMKLSDLVDRISRLLATDRLRKKLHTRLEKSGSGYFHDLADHYRLDHGFEVGAFEVRRITLDQPILTPAAFVPGQPPPNVSDLRYLLDVSGIPPLSRDQVRALAGRMAGEAE